ncbi:MAG: hypothetical protein QOH00_3095 [Gaiellales bacterium]|nr:hypothetical protein [Gaiellales bacterium]
MRLRPTLLAAALATLLTLPAGASAAILDVRIDTATGPALCVSTSALAASVTVAVGRPGGGTLATLASAVPQATQCDGSAGRSFRPTLPFAGLDGAAGATLAIADSTGDSVTVPFPVASFQTAHAGFSGILHLRDLPPGGTTQIANGSSIPVTSVASGSFDSGDIAAPGSAVTVTSTIGATPFRAVISPQPFAADLSVADGATAVTVRGTDPAGGAVAIDVTAPGGGLLVHTSALPRVGAGLSAGATLKLAAPAGAVVTAAQGAWSTSTRLGTATFTADGFSAAIPASAGGCAADHSCVTGTYAWSLALHDLAAPVGGTDPLGPCAALGPDVSGASGCSAFGGGTARTAVTATGELPVVDDSVTVALTEPSLGTSSLRVAAVGVRGSLDDGGLHVRGAARQPVAAAISSPRGALPALRATRTVLTDRGGVADLGPDRDAFPLHVADGASVSLSGAGVGSVPVAFRYRLAAGLAGAVLSGSATAGARVLVAHDQGGRVDQQLVVASASGAFAVTLHDPFAGDGIVITAGDPATHGVTTLSLIVGGFAPQITGLADQQPVHAGAVAGVTGVPTGGSVLWGGDLPETIGGTALTLPVERVPDGPARVTATALAGPSTTDYLYVVVDSTAPAGGAGPDQTVPVGRRAVFVTQARDANGLAAVRFRFTAKGNGVGQPVNQLGQPFRHAFTKLGIYAVTVTITDLAGNTTTDRAIVRVVRGVSSSVSGRWPARATHRAGIKTKLSARIPGDLSLQIVRPNGRVAVSRTLSFDKPRVGKKLSIALKHLPAGRYLAVRQFVDANGVAGPVVATPLVIA